MNNILITSLGKKILIQSENDSVRKYFESNIVPQIFIQEYSMSFLNNENTDFDIKVRHIQSNIQEIYQNFDKDHYLFLDNWQKNVPTYFLSFLQFLFNSLFLNDGVYTLHSATAQGNKYNFIFAGRAGSGKTTTVLELVKNHKFKFISNNKTSLKLTKNTQVNITGGTKGITVRDTDSFESYKDIAKSNFQEVYGGRTAFMFNEQKTAKLNIQRKTCLFSLKINPGVKEFKKLTEEEATIYLFPIFLESVDREVLLFNRTQPVPFPYDEYTMKKQALSDLKSILSMIEIYHLSGSLDFITDKVKEVDNS